MLGKTAVITGACSGLGLETSYELARRGVRVIMACEDLSKAERAKRSLVDRMKDDWSKTQLTELLLVRRLDLSSFRSVRLFAEEVNKQESRLDVLINNASVSGSNDRQLTEDGLEIAMGTNHFGHFLLTNLLLPLLKRSAPSRVLVVCSSHYQEGELRFDNLNSEKTYNVVLAYYTSQLAIVHFVRHLATQLEGTAVSVNAVDPGSANGEVRKRSPKWAQIFFTLVTKVLSSPKQAAATLVHLATSSCAETNTSGHFFVGCTLSELKHKDDNTARQLWEISEKITGLS